MMCYTQFKRGHSDNTDAYAIIETLKKGEGQVIGKDATEGNQKAAEVIEMYKLWRSCPSDNCAKALFEEAYREYKKSKVTPEAVRQTCL